MPHPFMTAWWSHVVMVSYAAPAAVLARYMPPGPGGATIEIDPWVDERAGRRRETGVVSLVAQQCSRVRVLGVKWPRLNRFDAVYLRFYVRERGGAGRGVVYVREIVPRRLIAAGARAVYNQPCVCAGVSSEVKQQTTLIGAEYTLRWGSPGQAPREHVVRVVGGKPAARASAGSLEAWVTDRPLVFGADKRGQGIVYEVIHAPPGVYPTAEAQVRVDFAEVFGADWGFLSQTEPLGAMLAAGGAGSEAAVFPKRRSLVVRWGVKR